MKKEKCENGHNQMMLLSDKEVESRKLQWQGAEICQKMHITKSSNKSLMQTKNTVAEMKVKAKFYSMIAKKVVWRARKVIRSNR